MLYQPCYGDQGYWVRPYTMFTEYVMDSVTGDQVPRFALIEADQVNEVLSPNEA